MLREGYTLGGRYLIQSIIGKGGTSIVYKALDLSAGNAERAVKEVFGEAIVEKEMETRLMADLYKNNNRTSFIPNIIDRLRFDEFPDTLFVVMDFIDGTDMNIYIKTSYLSFQKITEYAMDICNFISFIHDNNKIYSDMKPDNIMVINNNADDFKNLDNSKKFSNLKFIDFGATITEGTSTVAYTPEYAAPEQFMAKFEDILPTKTTDIFNIGATLYYMATGKRPKPVYRANGESKEDLVPSSERFLLEDKTINIELKRIIKKCTNDTPEMRYRSCAELFDDLRNISNHSFIKKTTLALIASFILLLSGSLAFIRYQSLHEASYEKYITAAQTSSDYKDKISYYHSALELNPGKMEAYIGIFEAYKDDVLFTLDEKNYIDKIITENTELLKQNGIYEIIEFEAGKLCWYYLDYGTDDNEDNLTTRMTSSVAYFDKARSGDVLKNYDIGNYQMADIYYNVGYFYKNIQNMIREGNDHKAYNNFWENLNSMIEFIDLTAANNELVLMETFNTAINSLLSYSEKFSTTGITYEEQMEFFNILKQRVNNTSVMKPYGEVNFRNAYELKQELLVKLDDTEKRINLTYNKPDPETEQEQENQNQNEEPENEVIE